MNRRLLFSQRNPRPRARAGRLLSIVKPIGRYAGEIITACALIGGWVLVTLAIARLARPDVVWPLSLGLFLLTVPGWPICSALVRGGLYGLMKDPHA